MCVVPGMWMQRGSLRRLVCSLSFSVAFLHFFFLIRVYSQLFPRPSQVSVRCKSAVRALLLDSTVVVKIGSAQLGAERKMG